VWGGSASAGDHLEDLGAEKSEEHAAQGVVLGELRERELRGES
jgi:hypothetical protein